MKKSIPFILAALAASMFAVGVQAQTASIRIDKNGVIPYAIDGNGNVERNPAGLCWRAAGIWSQQLAQSVKTLDGDKLPVGCYCDRNLMPAEACQAGAAPKAAEPAKAEPAKAAEPVKQPTATPEAKKVTLPADTLFAYDSATLSAEGRDKLAKFAADAKSLKQLEVVIAVGHADRIGSAAYNQKLSEKRAASVKDFLVGQGLPANKVYTEGKGKAQPVTGDSCKKMGAENRKNKKLIDCLARDRRVELEAVGSK